MQFCIDEYSFCRAKKLVNLCFVVDHIAIDVLDVKENFKFEELKGADRPPKGQAVPLTDALNGSLYFNDGFQECLRTHGVAIDSKNKTLTIQSGATKLDYEYNLKPEETVVRLKIKQTLINHSEPLIKGFKIVEDSQDATNAEILQIIENKRIDQNMEKDQEIEEDNEMKWGCTFFITAGIEFLSSIIRKLGSVPESYLEVFHKWNYAYIIIGIIISRNNIT